jgi:hypothetical protein
MAEQRTPQNPSSRPKVRSPRAIRTLVLCALAGAPAAACGPSQQGTDPVEPQPSADAGTTPDPGPVPAYGVPIEPDPGVEEYGVPLEPYQPVAEYAVVLPPDDAPVAVYAAPMSND